MYNKSYVRGWEVIHKNKKWWYTDNGESVSFKRPCKRCGKSPVAHMDSCLGKIPNATDACCGHGVEEGYILYKDGTKETLPLL